MIEPFPIEVHRRDNSPQPARSRSATRAAARRLGMPAELMLHYLYRVTYDTTNTRTALEDTGITCPRIEDYLPRLVAYFEQHLA